MSGVERMESLIRRYDDTIRYRQQLFDYNFAEEVHSVVQTCVKNQETVEAQLQEKTKECEYLRECLNIAYDKVAELYTQFEDRINHYQGLLKNNHAKEFLDFAIFLKTRNDSNEKINITLNSEGDDSFRHYEELLLKDDLAKEFYDNNTKHEFEALKLQFEDKTDECDRLKIRLNEVDEHISTLNSDLKAAHESLSAEKLQRSRAESEKSNLEDILLKFQQPVDSVDGRKETQNRTPSHHSAIYEDDLIEINSGIDFDHGLPISPPSNFRDDDVSVKNIDRCEFFFEKQQHQPETNTLKEASSSNSSVWPKLGERMPRQSTNYFVNESTFSLTTAASESPMQSDIADIEKDNNLRFVQESYDVNSPVDNSKLTAVENGKARKVLENSVIGSAIPKLPEPLMTNENSDSSKTLKKYVQKTTYPPDELPNSTIPSHQSNLECDTCGSSEQLVKCPTYDVHDNDHGDVNKKKSPMIAFEGEGNGKSRQINDISEKSKSEVLGWHCDICGRQYSCNSSLGAHIRKVHGGEKPYECIECGKRFAWKYEMKRHTLVHGSQKSFKCSVCNAGFKFSTGKRNHERIVHQGSTHLQCAHCDKRFSVKTNLISHIHTKHFTGFEKQFKCTICDKSFALKRNLQNHSITHTSQRSFKCSVCDCHFKHRGNKVDHEKTVHGKGVRFRCKHCDKVYKHNAFLIRHLRKDHEE